MIEQLKQTVIQILQKYAELKRELAEAKAAPPAEPTELAAANERATAAEAKVAELQATLAQLTSDDEQEKAAVSEVLTQLTAALAE